MPICSPRQGLIEVARQSVTNVGLQALAPARKRIADAICDLACEGPARCKRLASVTGSKLWHPERYRAAYDLADADALD